MEDYILREINKIGKIIEAILVKLGVLKRSGEEESMAGMAKTELIDKLGLDLDALLCRDDIAPALTQEHGFKNGDLEKFAELLFDLMEASGDPSACKTYLPAITRIFAYLRENSAEFSFGSYYILRELEKYAEA